MLVTGIEVEIDGLPAFEREMNLRVNAFEKAVEDLAAIVPGRLIVNLEIVEHRSTEGVLETLQKFGVGFKLRKKPEALKIPERLEEPLPEAKDDVDAWTGTKPNYGKLKR